MDYLLTPRFIKGEKGIVFAPSYLWLAHEAIAHGWINANNGVTVNGVSYKPGIESETQRFENDVLREASGLKPRKVGP
jgi:hypothetical protein